MGKLPGYMLIMGMPGGRARLLKAFTQGVLLEARPVLRYGDMQPPVPHLQSPLGYVSLNTNVTLKISSICAWR